MYCCEQGHRNTQGCELHVTGNVRAPRRKLSIDFRKDCYRHQKATELRNGSQSRSSQHTYCPPVYIPALNPSTTRSRLSILEMNRAQSRLFLLQFRSATRGIYRPVVQNDSLQASRIICMHRTFDNTCGEISLENYTRSVTERNPDFGRCFVALSPEL